MHSHTPVTNTVEYGRIYNDGMVRITSNSLFGRDDVIRDSLYIPRRENQTNTKTAENSRHEQNAGGHSDVSEMYSIEHYIRLYGATDVIFEMNVEYWIDYKMVDYICTVNNQRIGVSVTRAMGYPTADYFTKQKGVELLNKKLFGLIVARNATTQKHTFYKSILHVWCQNQRIADILEKVYCDIDLSEYGLDIEGEIVLHLTVCGYSPIYTNEL